MADATPDWHVEQQRLRTHIAQLRHNIERCKLEIMEMDSRTAKAVGNMKATQMAIVDDEKNLKALIAEHGAAVSPADGRAVETEKE